MHEPDPQLARLFRQCVLHYWAQRELLRGMIHTLGLRHPFVRSAYHNMPPVAPCMATVLQARAAAGRLMPGNRPS